MVRRGSWSLVVWRSVDFIPLKFYGVPSCLALGVGALSAGARARFSAAPPRGPPGSGGRLVRSIAASKTNNNNGLFFPATNGCLSHLRPSSAFYAQFTRLHSTKRPNAVRITHSSTQTGTGKHCSTGLTQTKRQHGLKQYALSLMQVHLEKAP